MKIPFNGNVNDRLLVKYYKGKVFYYVGSGSNNGKSGKYEIKPCKAEIDSWNGLIWRFDGYGQYEDWENIFDIWEEAKKECERRNTLYSEGFYQIPFVKLETLEKYKDKMLYIESTINKYMKGFENFQGIDFCDVSARGIQIRGHHKEIKKYTYGQQSTIEYDFSNADDVIWEFLKMWGEVDNPQAIERKSLYCRWGKVRIGLEVELKESGCPF